MDYNYLQGKNAHVTTRNFGVVIDQQNKLVSTTWKVPKKYRAQVLALSWAKERVLHCSTHTMILIEPDHEGDIRVRFTATFNYDEVMKLAKKDWLKKPEEFQTPDELVELVMINRERVVNGAAATIARRKKVFAVQHRAWHAQRQLDRLRKELIVG